MYEWAYACEYIEPVIARWFQLANAWHYFMPRPWLAIARARIIF